MTSLPFDPPPAPGGRPVNNTPFATKDDLRVLMYQLEVMQQRLKTFESRKEFETRIEMFAVRWEEFLSSAEFRFEKIQSQFQKQADIYKAHFRELQSKLAAVVGWVNERTKSDVVLNETIESQQQSLQTFELRMQQWQKILSEQELQSLNADSDKNRIEKMQAHLQRQTEAVQTAFQEMRAKVTAITSGMSDRRSHDTAINDLIERQRQMTQTFEARMQQAQKMMSEQELQLINSRTELKEVLKELSRLKSR